MVRLRASRRIRCLIPMKIADLRTEYMRAVLDESSVAPDPFRQFELWFTEAMNSELREPTAMTLATAAADGTPSARIVLLKEFDERGFTFFSNYTSRKGRELADRLRAALLFFWPDLERQVRIEGAVIQLARSESIAYFSGRPRASQLGAWASDQSQPIAGRAALITGFSEADAKYAVPGLVPCPPHWGGYRVVPEAFEFWQGRVSRMHDRIRYRRRRDDPGGWVIDRLAP